MKNQDIKVHWLQLLKIYDQNYIGEEIFLAMSEWEGSQIFLPHNYKVGQIDKKPFSTLEINQSHQ